MEIITTEDVMDKLDMFQTISGKVDDFGWDLEIISLYAGTQLTSTKFQYKCQTCGVWITFVAPEYQETASVNEHSCRK